MQHEVELQLKDINGLLSDIIQSLLMNKKAAISDDKLKEVDRKMISLKLAIDSSTQSISEIDYPVLPQLVSDVEAYPCGEFLVVQWKDNKNDASDLQCYHIYINNKLKQTYPYHHQIVTDRYCMTICKNLKAGVSTTSKFVL